MTSVQIQNRSLCAHAIWRKTVLSGLWVNGHRYVLVVVYREKKRFLKWFRLSKGKLASEAEPITVPGELNIDRLSMHKVEGTVQEFFNLPEANNSFNLNFQKRRFYSFLYFHLLTNHKTERGSLARRSHALFLDCTWQAQKLYIAR